MLIWHCKPFVYVYLCLFHSSYMYCLVTRKKWPLSPENTVRVLTLQDFFSCKLYIGHEVSIPWWLLPMSANNHSFANLAEVSQSSPSLFLECLSVAIEWLSKDFLMKSRHTEPYALHCWDSGCLLTLGEGEYFWGPYFLAWTSLGPLLGLCYQSVSLSGTEIGAPIFPTVQRKKQRVKKVKELV